MKTLHIALAGMLIAGSTADLQAQRLTFDLRPVVATPGELAGADLDKGLGIGATIAFQVQPHLHLYGGWDWLQFGADDSFVGPAHDFGETGYSFGLRFEHPFVDVSSMLYRIEAGGTYKHVEIENDAGDIVADSKHSLGYELGVGLLWPMGNAWRIGPTLRFRSLHPDFDIAGATTSGTLRYMGLELGVSRRF